MFAVDNASAVAELPAPLAPGTPGYFGRGDPGSGIRPTTVPADFLNMVQSELLAILVAADITPSKTEYNQVLEAIETLITMISAPIYSTDVSGNWKVTYPGGGVEMGGVVPAALTSEGPHTVTFPFGGFSTACIDFSAAVINSSSSGSGTTVMQEISLSNTAGALYAQDNSSSGWSDAAGGFRWRARGN